MSSIEREYRDALDGLRFSGADKERMMNGLMEAEKIPVKGKYFRPLRPALIAACLVLALLGTAVAVRYAGVTITKGDDGITFLQGGITYYSYDSLSDQLKAREGFKEKPNGKLIRPVSSWQAAEDFIGVNLMDNPVLDGCPATNFSHKYDGVMGDYLIVADPDLSAVLTYGCYEMGEANIMVEAHLFTDRKATLSEDWDEQFLGYMFPDGTIVYRDTYTASNGLTAQILEYTCPGDTPTCKAAFSLNGIPTIVTVSDSPDVREVLYQVLDGFIVE